MADTVTFQTTVATPPDGTVVLTDETASGHAQVVKLAISTDGSATLIPAVAADGLLVNLGTNNDVVVSDGGNTITVDGTVTANAGTNLNTSALALEVGGNLAAAATSLAALDNAVAGNEFQVDVLTVPAPLSTTGTGTEATALRVTIATDSTGLVSVDDNGGALTVDNGGTFAVQVDGSALTALQLIDDIVYTDDTSTHATGTSKGALIMAAAVPTDSAITANDIGAVAMTLDRKLHVAVMDAIPAGTSNIGDVDVLTIAAGDNNIGNVDVVTVPTDPFGANADAASATGSFSAKLRGIATALGITALDLGSGTGGSRTLRWFHDTAQWIGGTGVDGSAVQRVSLATNVALPAGTNNIGDVDVLTLPAKKLTYAASAALTQTNLDGIASSSTHVAGWESGAIDNSSNLYLDYAVNAVIQAESASLAAGEIRMYFVAELNDTTWPDVFDGTESTETVTDTLVRDAICRLGAITATDTTASQFYYLNCPSVAAVFNGALPRKFVVFITQSTGTTLETTGDPNQVYIRGVYLT